jgi:hypothetical protein
MLRVDHAASGNPNRRHGPSSSAETGEFDSPLAIGLWTEPGLVARQRDSIDWDER